VLDVGMHVAWIEDSNHNEGLIIDFYQFKTKKYYKKHKHAVLIKCNNGKHVLKLENEIITLN